MKKEIRRSGTPRQNYAQGSYNKSEYNSQRRQQQYQELSSGYYMYTANAVARDYQYEEERKSVQKVAKVKKPHRSVLVQHLSTILIVFIMGLTLVGQYTVIQSLGYQVSQVKTELKTVQDQNEKMKKQIASIGELKTVEMIAVNNMGMHKPTNDEIIYLPQTTAQESEKTESAADKAVNQAKDVIGTILP
jgi:hypothetical protein